eukprot:7116692-Pyramimonas_sp.AAC.1
MWQAWRVSTSRIAVAWLHPTCGDVPSGVPVWWPRLLSDQSPVTIAMWQSWQLSTPRKAARGQDICPFAPRLSD